MCPFLVNDQQSRFYRCDNIPVSDLYKLVEVGLHSVLCIDIATALLLILICTFI